MPVNTYHLRSSIKGKEPTAGNNAGQLPVGSIAINFNADEPFLAIQDSTGSVRRIAGVKIDSTAPTTPTSGEFWLDTSSTDRILKVFDGTAWAAAGKPIPDATTTVKGIVQLADAAAITAGTAGLIVDAAQLKAAAPPDASDTVKGIVELATATETTAGTDGTRAVTPAGLKVELDKKANLVSPALTGTPTAPTAAAGTNTTQIATTEFVTAAVAVENLWDRTGTVVSPSNAGDQVHTGTGKLTVGGTAAAPAVSIDPGATGSPFVRDSSGNVGVGLIPSTWSVGKALQVGSAGNALFGATNGQLNLMQNANFDGDYKYLIAAAASYYQQLAGSHIWHTAPSGTAGAVAGFSEKLRLTNDGKLLIGSGGAGGYAVSLDPGTTGSPLVRDSSGRVGIGTTAPSAPLHVKGGTPQLWLEDSAGGPGGKLRAIGSNNGALTFLRYLDNGTLAGEHGRFDADGRLLVGTSNGLGSALLQVEGNTSSSTGEAIVFLRRGQDVPTIGANVGSVLGQFRFVSKDGGWGATIGAESDATWSTAGSGDYPSRLVFSTCPDSGSSPAERMRITQAGEVQIGGTPGSAPAIKLSPNGKLFTTFSAVDGGTGNASIETFSSPTMDAALQFNLRSKPGGIIFNGNQNVDAVISGTGMNISMIADASSFPAAGVRLVSNQTTWQARSDERHKENLVEINNGLSKVSQLRAAIGNFIDDPSKVKRSFLIAQDVLRVLPEAVDTSNADRYELRYTEVIPLLVSALKESKERIETLEAKVAALGTP